MKGLCLEDFLLSPIRNALRHKIAKYRLNLTKVSHNDFECFVGDIENLTKILRILI